jgi:hypothetical protein
MPDFAEPDVSTPYDSDEVWHGNGDPYELLPDDVYREGFDDNADYEWTEVDR